jgi:hypothetical protein
MRDEYENQMRDEYQKRSAQQRRYDETLGLIIRLGFYGMAVWAIYAIAHTIFEFFSA